MAHARKSRIAQALSAAKLRDGYRCRVCKQGPPIGSHCFPRNVQKPDDPSTIVTLCFLHDKQFDSLHFLPDRAKWLRENGLSEFADAMAKLDGRCV